MKTYFCSLKNSNTRLYVVVSLVLGLLSFFGTLQAQQNLAIGKRAYQSSTMHGASANRAVDGSTNGLWHNGSVTCTKPETGAWWEVDLAADYELSRIVIFSRTDTHVERLNSMEVLLSRPGANPTSIWSAGNTNSAGRIEIKLPTPIKARYLTIRLKDKQQLSLAEVQVFGTEHSRQSRAGHKAEDSKATFRKVNLYSSSQ